FCEVVVNKPPPPPQLPPPFTPPPPESPTIASLPNQLGPGPGLAPPLAAPGGPAANIVFYGGGSPISAPVGPGYTFHLSVTGAGLTEVGIYRRGEWFIDVNGNGVWDEGDLYAKLGSENDLPITGDWDGDGKTDIGVFGPEWATDPRAIMAETGLPDRANEGPR